MPLSLIKLSLYRRHHEQGAADMMVSPWCRSPAPDPLRHGKLGFRAGQLFNADPASDSPNFSTLPYVNASATLITVPFSNGFPTTCNPRGSPSDEDPAGTDMAGRPAKFTVIV
jgi:hypothetical protein